MAKPGTTPDPTLINDAARSLLQAKKATDSVVDSTNNWAKAIEEVGRNRKQLEQESLAAQRGYNASWNQIQRNIEDSYDILKQFKNAYEDALQNAMDAEDALEAAADQRIKLDRERLSLQAQIAQEIQQQIQDELELLGISAKLETLAAKKQESESIFGPAQEEELAKLQSEYKKFFGTRFLLTGKLSFEPPDLKERIEKLQKAKIDSEKIYTAEQRLQNEQLLQTRKSLADARDIRAVEIIRLQQSKKQTEDNLKLADEEINKLDEKAKKLREIEQARAREKVALEAILYLNKELEKINKYLLASYTEYDKLVAKNAKEQGILRSQSVEELKILSETSSRVKSISDAFKNSTVNLEQMAEASAAINNSFGVLAGRYMPEATLRVTQLSNAIGISAKDSEKFFENLAQIGNTSFQSQQNMAGFADAVSKASKVPLGTIINDVVKAGGNLRLIFKGNTEELIKQTAELRRMGSSLDSAAKSAESLLNFESSIGNELKVSALLGQSVNFNEARRLFFSGKVKEGEQAIVRELEKIGDLDKLNYFQRKALADATGKDFETLQKMASQKKTLAEIDRQNPELAKERRKYEEELKKIQGNSNEQKERANQLAAMENVAKARALVLDEQKRKLSVAIGQALRPILDFWYQIQTAVFATVTFLIDNDIGRTIITWGGGILLSVSAIALLIKSFTILRTTIALTKAAFSALSGGIVSTATTGIKSLFGIQKATEAVGEGVGKTSEVMKKSSGGMGGFSKGMEKLGEGAKKLSDGLKPLAPDLLKAAAAFLIFAVGVIGIAYAFTLIKDVPIKQMIVFAGVVAGLTYVLSKTAEGISKNKASFASMAGLTLAIIGLAYAFSLLGKVSVSQMLAFAASVSILGFALSIFGKVIGENKNAMLGIGVIALSIAGMAAAFSLLEKVSVTKMAAFGITVGLLATALVILGYVAAPVLPIIIGISASIVGLGLAMLMAGAGVKLMGEGFGFVMSKITEFTTAIVGLVEKGFQFFINVLKEIPPVLLSVTSSLIAISLVSPLISVAAISLAALGSSLIGFGLIIAFFPEKQLQTISKSIVEIANSAKDLILAIVGASSSLIIIKNLSDSLITLGSSSLISSINSFVDSLKQIKSVSEIKFPSIDIKENNLLKITLLTNQLNTIYPIIKSFDKLPAISIKTEGLNNAIITFDKLSFSLVRLALTVSHPLILAGLTILNISLLILSTSMFLLNKSLEKILNNIKNISKENLLKIVSFVKELSVQKSINLEINIKGLTNDLITKIKNLSESLKSLSKIDPTKEISDNIFTKINNKLIDNTKNIIGGVNNLIKSASKTVMPKLDFDIKGLNDSLINKLKAFNLFGLDTKKVSESLKSISNIKFPPMEFDIKGLTKELVDKLKGFVSEVSNIKLFTDSLKSLSNIKLPPFEFNIKGLTTDLIENFKKIINISEKINTLSNSLKSLSKIKLSVLEFDIKGLTTDLINKLKNMVDMSEKVNLLSNSIKSLSEIKLPTFDFNIKGLTTDLINKFKSMVDISEKVNTLSNSLKSLSEIKLPTFDFNIKGLTTDLIDKFKSMIDMFGKINLISDSLKALSNIKIPTFEFDIKGLTTDLINKLKNMVDMSEKVNFLSNSLKSLSNIKLPIFEFNIKGLTTDLIDKFKSVVDMSEKVNFLSNSLKSLSDIKLPTFDFNIKGLTADLINKFKSMVDISEKVNSTSVALKSLSNIKLPTFDFNIKGLTTDLIDKIKNLINLTDKFNEISTVFKNISNITIPKFNFNITGLTDELINKIKQFASSSKEIQSVTSSLSALSKLTIPSFEFNISGLTKDLTDQIDKTAKSINLIVDSIKSMGSALTSFPISQLKETFDKIILFGQNGFNIKNSSDVVKELSNINLSGINLNFRGIDTELTSRFKDIEETSENIKTNLLSLQELPNIELPKLNIDEKSIEALSKYTDSKEKQTTDLKLGLDIIAQRIDKLTQLMIDGGIAVNIDGQKVNHVFDTARTVRGTYGQSIK